MDPAYATSGWENFAVAEVGASAALAGLLFVAVSINLARILAVPSLPGRVVEALAILVQVLLVGTFVLVPGQSTTTLGIELIGVGVVVLAVCSRVQLHAGRQPEQQRRWIAQRVALTLVSTLPIIAAGSSLIALRGGGLYWTVAGVAMSILAGLVDAWVLLIEIQR